MRKLLIVILLVGAFGLFAQIPVGTKEVGVEADIGDLLAKDFTYLIHGYGGYFFIDNLEGLLGVGLGGTTMDLPEGFKTSALGLTIGAYYHAPMSEMLGFFGGAWLGYQSGVVGSTAEGYTYIPFDAGVEFFITKYLGIRVFDRFTINLKEGMDNTDHIMVSSFAIF